MAWRSSSAHDQYDLFIISTNKLRDSNPWHSHTRKAACHKRNTQHSMDSNNTRDSREESDKSQRSPDSQTRFKAHWDNSTNTWRMKPLADGTKHLTRFQFQLKSKSKFQSASFSNRVEIQIFNPQASKSQNQNQIQFKSKPNRLSTSKQTRIFG